MRVCDFEKYMSKYRRERDILSSFIHLAMWVESMAGFSWMNEFCMEK